VSAQFLDVGVSISSTALTILKSTEWRKVQLRADALQPI
jgi:hypothetical protein